MQNKLVSLGALLSLVLICFFGGIFYYNKIEVYHLTLATSSSSLGQAIAQVVLQQNPRIHIKFMQTKGSRENMKLLEENKVQLIVAQSDTTPVAPARIVLSLFKESFELIVTEDSGIKAVSDLRGKRIALMQKESGSYNSYLSLLEHYGLQESEVQSIHISPKEVDQLLSNGQVDAIFLVVPSGSNFVRDILQNNRVQLVAIDQAQAMKIKRPYLEADVIPKGTYKGNPPIPSEDLSTIGIKANLLAHQNLSPKVVREITRILFDYRRTLVKDYPAAVELSSPLKEGKLTLPVHPGAQAYYDREKPNFFKENTGVIGLSLSIGTLVASWFFKLRSQFLKKQKNRADRYNSAILELMDLARQEKSLEKMQIFEEELFTIFQEIISDLSQDRIAMESFQSFTFTWETALRTLQDRENFLRELQRSAKI